MKPRILPLLLVISLGTVTTPAYSAQAADGSAPQSQTGIVEGRVQNEATGLYLNNARVTVKGTVLRVFTDESGSYRLTNVPVGINVLEVFYTGLEPQELAVNLPADQRIIQNISLKPPGASIVKMDAYMVETSREMDQAMIAINEQRFASNIRTVVSTGDLSEHVDGNIAQFLKFVPGISTDDTRAGGGVVSVRGFPSEFTEVNQDGAKAATAPLSDLTRQTSMQQQMSITNVARIEVLKVPTPSTGADTMAGSINLVSRSAFESVRSSFRYQATLSGEHSRLSLKKKPSLWDKKLYYSVPAFSFTYTNPVTANFGFTVSGSHSEKILTEDNYAPTHNMASATFGSSISAPALTSASIRKIGTISRRDHVGMTADWRMAPHSVLSVSLQTYASRRQNGNKFVTFNTGTIATPTVPGAAVGSFGADHTIGAMGRGSVVFSSNNQDQNYAGVRGKVRYTFDDGTWKIDAQSSPSSARTFLRTLPDRGTLRNVPVSTTIPLRVEFHDIDPRDGPGAILVVNSANQVIDPTDRSIHEFTSVGNPTTNAKDIRTDIMTYSLDARRRLSALPFPASFQFGGARKVEKRDWTNTQTSTYTYSGPGGSVSAAPFISPHAETIFGIPYTSLISPVFGADQWNVDPSQFFQTPAQVRATELARILAERFIKETADALYFQAEVSLFNNRLGLLTGVRYERTAGEGLGPLVTPDAVFVRNADGSYARTPTGARIRRPEAGASNSLEQLRLTHHERAAHSRRTYDGYYPSLHLTYSVTENFLARAAYARTYGRPNFNFVIPQSEVREELDGEGMVMGGLLIVSNPGLRPWTAGNYDLSAEYYTKQGGVLGAGVFRKDVTGMFGVETRDATQLELTEAGIDGSAMGWEVRTTTNVGNARVDGLELNVSQSLSVLDPWLADWGSNFRVFANITKIKLSGGHTADFAGFLPTTANWGIQFARKRVSTSLKWNYRSEQNVGAVADLGPNGFNYVPARTHLDLNASYNLSRSLGFFIQMRNVTRVFSEPSKRSDILPEYARLRSSSTWDGIAADIGIKGRF